MYCEIKLCLHVYVSIVKLSGTCFL